MSFALHALAADFQDHSAEILAKVQVDGDFADLVAQYLDINAKVYRAEAEFDLMTYYFYVSSFRFFDKMSPNL